MRHLNRLLLGLVCSAGCQSSGQSGYFKATISNSTATPPIAAKWNSSDTQQLVLSGPTVCLLASDHTVDNPSGSGLLIVLPTQPNAGQTLPVPVDSYFSGAANYISFTQAPGNLVWAATGGNIQVNKIDPWQVALSAVTFAPTGGSDPNMGAFTLDGEGEFLRDPTYQPTTP